VTGVRLKTHIWGGPAREKGGVFSRSQKKTIKGHEFHRESIRKKKKPNLVGWKN